MRRFIVPTLCVLSAAGGVLSAYCWHRLMRFDWPHQ